MSQPRMHHPEFVHLVTNRTERGLFFMTPRRDVVHLIRYWLARARNLYGPRIEIYGFCFLSNHFHMLLRDAHGELATFMEYFSGNVARAINRAMGRRQGAFWSREYDDQIVDGEEAFMNTLAYVMANPVKSGLVDLPSQWKGVSSLECMLNDTAFSETGLNLSEYNEATRHGRKVNRSDFENTYSFSLSVPPMWRCLSRDQRREKLTDLLKSASANYRKMRKSHCAIGMKKILSQRVTDAPKNFSPTPRRRFHCSSVERLKQLQETLRDFVGRYRECLQVYYRQIFSKARRRVATVINWPPGCFPPSCVHPLGC